jgi:hypothetical protein
MTSLSPGDEDLHDPSNDTLHVWMPPGPPDEQTDRKWIARAKAHANAHAARATAPVIDEELEHERR